MTIQMTEYEDLTIYWEYDGGYWERKISIRYDTKEDYLKWRSKWRKAYATISSDIRRSKKSRKQYIWSRKNGKKIKIGDNPLHIKSENIGLKEAMLPWNARFLLEARKLSKVAAEISYQRLRQAA